MEKCKYCGRHYEGVGMIDTSNAFTFMFSDKFCSLKCKIEYDDIRKAQQKEKQNSQIDNPTIKYNNASNEVKGALYDENGLPYTPEISKMYATSEEAQKAEKKQRKTIATLGIIIIILGVLLCFVSPFIGIPIAIIGIILYGLSRATFTK
jgi:hypothetical protein